MGKDPDNPCGSCRTLTVISFLICVSSWFIIYIFIQSGKELLFFQIKCSVNFWKVGELSACHLGTVYTQLFFINVLLTTYCFWKKRIYSGSMLWPKSAPNRSIQEFSLCWGCIGAVLLALLSLIQSVYYLSFRMCLFWYQKVSKCIFHCIVLFPQFPRNLFIKWCVMILEVSVLGALQLFYFSITMKLFSAWTCSVSYLFQKDYLLSQGRMNVLRPKWKEMN